MRVNNLQDLINELGKETVDKLFMEYMLLQKAKAEQFDVIATKIDVTKYIDTDEIDYMQ